MMRRIQKGRSNLSIRIVILITILFSVSAFADSRFVFTKAFSPNPIVEGNTARLTFTLEFHPQNAQDTALTQVEFFDNLPGALVFRRPSNLTIGSDCNGLIPDPTGADPESKQFHVRLFDLPASNGDIHRGCTISIDVFVPASSCLLGIGPLGAFATNTVQAQAFVQHPVGSDLVFATATDSLLVLPGTNCFSIHHFSSLNRGDSLIDITNVGAQTTAGGVPTNICVNVYAFSPDEQMVSCCSCPVTPNGLVSLSVRDDLISNTLTPAIPTSIVVKLSASVPVGGTCASSAALPGALASGMAAWGTTLHAGVAAGFFVTETAFTPTPLSDDEATRLTSLCTFLNTNGSGFGICRSCRLGGLGAAGR